MIESGPPRGKEEYYRKRKILIEIAYKRIEERKEARNEKVKEIESELRKNIAGLGKKISREDIEDIEDNAAEDIRRARVRTEDQIETIMIQLDYDISELKREYDSNAEDSKRLQDPGADAEITRELDEIGERARRDKEI